MNEVITQSSQNPSALCSVLRLEDVDTEAVEELLSTYGLSLKTVAIDMDIPGSFWGDEEAGLIGDQLLVRADTPLHSILHESCHYICMDKTRRQSLDTNAGGTHDEENAVCYLQILLAEQLSWMGRERMFSDMDTWGYSFRLGSARAWFERDAEDTRDWLFAHDLIDIDHQPTLKLR